MRKRFLKNKSYYELNGQESMFGHDNLSFKTVNMPKKQNFDNICSNFKLKMLTNKISLKLSIIYINKI